MRLFITIAFKDREKEVKKYFIFTINRHNIKIGLFKIIK